MQDMALTYYSKDMNTMDDEVESLLVISSNEKTLLDHVILVIRNLRKIIMIIFALPLMIYVLPSMVEKIDRVHIFKGDITQTQVEPNVTTTHEQRIVLLAGPHKTSSSSIQMNMYNWLYQGNGSALQEEWAFPSIEEKYFEMNCNFPPYLQYKIFYPLLEALRGVHRQDPKTRCLNAFYTREEIINLYKNEMEKKWKQGQSLVLASEAMDFIASSNEDDGYLLLNALLDFLPTNEEDDESKEFSSTTAVVMYRPPRVSHLISAWHQCCMKKMSFYNFLTSMRNSGGALKTLDSLLLAERFAQRKINTVLVDLSGVKHHEYDISNVIACDVLDAKCNAEKKPEVSISPMITNVKKHSKDNLNVTDAQIASIDKVIESYDCHFKHVLTSNDIQVLYPHDIKEIMHSCSNTTSYNGSVSKLRQQTVRQIRQILQ